MQLTHLHTYKQRVEQIYGITFKKAFGRPVDNIRQTAYYVAYTFTGLSYNDVGAIFELSGTCVLTGVHRQRGYIGMGETKLYNDLLNIYIDSCKEFLNGNPGRK